MEKKATSPLMAGLLISLILIVIDLVGGFTHLKYETWWGWIGGVVMLIAIIMFCISWANQKNNLVTFGNVFGYGFKASAVIAVIILIYSFLSMYVIFPETRDIIMDTTRKKMEAAGNLSEDQMDQALAMTKKFLVLGPIFGGIFTLIIGIIGGLLGGAFAKKKPITPFDQPNA